MNNLSIKKLDSSDFSDLLKLEQELFANPFSDKSLLDELNQSSRFYVGGFIENNLIAFAGASLVEDSADIIKIGVAKKFWRQGFGKQILNSLVLSLKQIGIKQIILEVEHTNVKAINLYLTYGFKQIADRKNYYGTNKHAKILILND